MEKENLKNFSIIDNRGTNNPINASCDHIIDKNGNVIYKCYNNLYKLTYRHIYKYKRITTFSTDVIFDKNYNSYTPLYHYYYDDVNKNGNVNLDECKDHNDIDEITYNEKSTKQICLKYDLNELLLLRFLNYNAENDSEEILNKNCFLKEKKFSKSNSGKFHKDRNNTNTLISTAVTNHNTNELNNNININSSIRIRNTYNDDNSQGINHNYSLNSVNNINTKVFKNLDDNYYNLPINNIYIDKEGKMHLTGKDFYNSNNNFNNKITTNKYDRSLNFQKKEKDLMDYDYNEKVNIRKNNSEKYWDNPSHYSKRNNYDIFTLGDIKKYSKNNEKQKNSINLNDNSYSIFKDNEEENLTKSNFAKWFKNNNINVNENVDIIKYLNNKNKQANEDLKSGQKSFNINRNCENDIYNKNDYSFNMDAINTGSNEEKISNTVAELLLKQISMIKERKSMDNLEKKNSLGFFDSNFQSSNSMNIDKNSLTENEIYSKEAGKKILEIFKSFNSNNMAKEQLEQQQSYNNNGNENFYNNNNNNNNKYYSMDNMTYKKNFIDNYMNDSSNIDHLITNKKSMNKEMLNNYNLQENNKIPLNSFNNLSSSNIDNYEPYNNFDSYKSKNNNGQCNINITPIINSLLRIGNEYEHDNRSPSNPSNYISENIQNAKVNNVLDSLKSLLKASKNQNNKNFSNSKNFNQSNKYMNYHSQQYYPSQPIQQHRSSFNDFNKKKFLKKDKFNVKYPESDITTNETIMALKNLIQNQNEIKK